MYWCSTSWNRIECPTENTLTAAGTICRRCLWHTIGAEAVEDDGEPFDEKMKRLTIKLDEQFRESAQLEQAIRENLCRLTQ